MTEKIKAKLPTTVNVIHDLNKNTVSIAHDGEPVETKLPECGMSLDWYLEDADLLFKSGADDVSLYLKDSPSEGVESLLTVIYSKLSDTAANTRVGPQRRITYVTQQCYAGREIKVDAKLVEAYRQKVAQREDFEKRNTSFH